MHRIENTSRFDSQLVNQMRLINSEQPISLSKHKPAPRCQTPNSFTNALDSQTDETRLIPSQPNNPTPTQIKLESKYCQAFLNRNNVLTIYAKHFAMLRLLNELCAHDEFLDYVMEDNNPRGHRAAYEGIDLGRNENHTHLGWEPHTSIDTIQKYLADVEVMMDRSTFDWSAQTPLYRS